MLNTFRLLAGCLCTFRSTFRILVLGPAGFCPSIVCDGGCREAAAEEQQLISCSQLIWARNKLLISCFRNKFGASLVERTRGMGGRLQAAAETVSNVCDSEYTRNVPLRLVKTHSSSTHGSLPVIGEANTGVLTTGCFGSIFFVHVGIPHWVRALSRSHCIRHAIRSPVSLHPAVPNNLGDGVIPGFEFCLGDGG